MRKKALFFGALALGALALWQSGLTDYLSFQSLKDHDSFLRHWIQDRFFLALLSFIAVYALVVGFSVPGATFMTLASGYFFGILWGTAGAVMGATLGASLLFVGVKWASKDYMAKIAGPYVKKMSKGFREDALSYMLTLRLIPLFPFAAINLVAAVLQIPFRHFFWGTLLGIIPGTFVYVNLGQGLGDLRQQGDFHLSQALTPPIIVGLAGLGILSLLPVLYKKIQKKGKA